MRLPNDYSRCMDDECPLLGKCARYVQPPTVVLNSLLLMGGCNGWPVADSLWGEDEDECHAFIEEESC